MIRKRDFSLSGDYRNIICKPYDLEYEILSDKSKDLAKSDWDLMQQASQPNSDTLSKEDDSKGEYNFHFFV